MTGGSDAHTSERREGQMLLAKKLYAARNECKALAGLMRLVLLCCNKQFISMLALSSEVEKLGSRSKSKR